MRERGSGLLDAVGATAVALTLGIAATDVTLSISTLGRTARREGLLTVARNWVDRAAAAPCAPSPPCPQGVACDLARESLDGVVADASRIIATVTDDADASLRVRLATVAPANCG
jgi:hypothetical protein